MGIGEAEGENRAAEAARAAVSSPLLEASVAGATGVLLNITGGPDLGLFEVNESAEVVTGASDLNANVIFGAVIDEAMGGRVRVTVIATGFDKAYRREPLERDREEPIAEREPGEGFECRPECSRFRPSSAARRGRPTGRLDPAGARHGRAGVRAAACLLGRDLSG